MTVYFDHPRYTWDFGDGSTKTVTNSPGGPYPTGDVTHVYTRAAKYTVTLTVEWHVTYDVTVGGVTTRGYDFGYVDQPGQQTFPVNVVEAHAVLIG